MDRSATKTTAGRIIHALIDAVRHFDRGDGWAMASHVTLSILMSLFPFLIFATALAGFLGNAEMAEEMIAIVFETWPEQVAKPIADEINTIVRNSKPTFLTAGIALALFFGSNGVEALRIALNRAYRVEDQRSWLFCRLQSLLFVFLSSVVLLVVATMLVFIPLLSSIIDDAAPIVAEYDATAWFLRHVVALATLGVGLYACHLWLPAGHRSMASLWPGVALTIFAWFLAANLFRAYLENFADYGAVFGGLTGTFTAIIFLLLMSVILILGGEFNAAIAKMRAEPAVPAPRGERVSAGVQKESETR